MSPGNGRGGQAAGLTTTGHGFSALAPALLVRSETTLTGALRDDFSMIPHFHNTRPDKELAAIPHGQDGARRVGRARSR